MPGEPVSLFERGRARVGVGRIARGVAFDVGGDVRRPQPAGALEPEHSQTAAGERSLDLGQATAERAEQVRVFALQIDGTRPAPASAEQHAGAKH